MNWGWPEWIAWGGIVLPLLVLAWTAFWFAQEKRDQRKRRRFDDFFAVTDKVGQSEGSLLSKVAAVHELRRFPEYSEVILRMTENPEITGGGRAVELLATEFRMTHEAMKDA